MKKLTTAFLLVSMVALVFAGSAFAQTETPQNPGYGGGGGGPNTTGTVGTGIFHDYLMAYYADVFGIDADVLTDRLTAGETIYDIALAQGYTFAEFVELKIDARLYALENALADGLIDQDMFDFLSTRGMGTGSGSGTGTGGGGRGNGQGGGGGAGTGTNPDCPYYSAP